MGIRLGSDGFCCERKFISLKICTLNPRSHTWFFGIRIDIYRSLLYGYSTNEILDFIAPRSLTGNWTCCGSMEHPEIPAVAVSFLHVASTYMPVAGCQQCYRWGIKSHVSNEFVGLGLSSRPGWKAAKLQPPYICIFPLRSSEHLLWCTKSLGCQVWLNVTQPIFVSYYHLSYIFNFTIHCWFLIFCSKQKRTHFDTPTITICSIVILVWGCTT